MGLYEMPINGITLGGQSVVSGPRAILDSGTNVLLVPTPVFDSFRKAFKALCDAGKKLKGVCDVAPGSKGLLDGGCQTMTEAEVAAFPQLTLGITKGGLEMSPSKYLLPDDPRASAQGQLCLGIRDTGAHGFFIVGDTTMSGYYVAFDREKSRIGWAKRTSSCGSL